MVHIAVSQSAYIGNNILDENSMAPSCSVRIRSFHAHLTPYHQIKLRSIKRVVSDKACIARMARYLNLFSVDTFTEIGALDEDLALLLSKVGGKKSLNLVEEIQIRESIEWELPR